MYPTFTDTVAVQVHVWNAIYTDSLLVIWSGQWPTLTCGDHGIWYAIDYRMVHARDTDMSVTLACQCLWHHHRPVYTKETHAWFTPETLTCQRHWHISVSGITTDLSTQSRLISHSCLVHARDTDMSETLTLWHHHRHVSVSGLSSRLNKGSRLNKADCRGDHLGVVASIDSAWSWTLGHVGEVGLALAESPTVM